jgi:hypothetical protein
MKALNQHKSVLFVLATLLCVPMAFSQPDKRGNKKDKIEDLKIAFITKELDLTSEEAQQFWPVYNEMAKKLKEEKKKQRLLTKEMRDNSSSFTEADFKKKSGEFMDSEILAAQKKKEYHEKIAGIIGYKKATKLLSLEQRFKRELLNRVNDTQGDKPRGKKQGGPRPD